MRQNFTLPRRMLYALVEGQSMWVGTLLQKKPYDPVARLSPITVVNAFPFMQ